MRDHWEDHAASWVQWARAQGHDAYWSYGPVFFQQMVPPPGRLTVEIGCGKGRVARDLSARGHRVLALDSSATLISHAKSADASGAYVRADATRLPLRSGCADLVVAYNVLMDVDDMPAAVRAVEDAGLVIERLREPPAPPARLAHKASSARWQRLPNFLFLRCRKIGATA